jgi:hypothetical protein
MMSHKRLVGWEDLSYNVGITDQRISIASDMEIWICINAAAGVFL